MHMEIIFVSRFVSCYLGSDFKAFTSFFVYEIEI